MKNNAKNTAQYGTRKINLMLWFYFLLFFHQSSIRNAKQALEASKFIEPPNVCPMSRVLAPSTQYATHGMRICIQILKVEKNHFPYCSFIKTKLDVGTELALKI